MGSVRLPPLQLSEREPSLSELSDDPYARSTRRTEIRRGGKSLLAMEELADKTWRHITPRSVREEFVNKLGPLRSIRHGKSTRSNPTMSPRVSTTHTRTGARTPLSLASYAAVTDKDYLTSMDRRLIYDRQNMLFREQSNIFPTDKDYEEANRPTAHSPRAVSYVPALARRVGKRRDSHPAPRPPKLTHNGTHGQSPSHTERRRSSVAPNRHGPTQYQSNAGVVMVMKPPQHALVGTSYEHRPIQQEYHELQQFRLHPEQLLREDTTAMLARCDKLLHPAHEPNPRRPRKEALTTPTDWNRSISRSPNLQDLRSQLDNASPFMLSEQRRGGVEHDRKEYTQAVVMATNLQKAMRPEGRPVHKHYVDSAAKCSDWINKNFS